MAEKVATTIKMDLTKQVGRAWTGVHLAQDRDRWWIPVNMIMNMRIPQNVGNFLTAVVDKSRCVPTNNTNELSIL